MPASLRSRLLLTYLALIAALLTIAVLAILFNLRNDPFVHRQAYLRLEELARVMARRELPELRQGRTPEALSAMAAQFSETYDVRVLLLGPDGALVADGRAGGGAIDFASAQQTQRGARSTRGLGHDSSKRDWLFVTFSLAGDRTLVLAEPAPRMPALSLFREEVLPPLARAGWVALGLSVVFAVLMARWIAGPLQRLAKATHAVAQGRYDQSLPLEGPSEVRDVAASFNEMTGRVKSVNQAQRDFVANVSHELRTPLTSIGGFAQAILDGTAGSPDALHRAATVIHDEAERMRRLVDELLELARFDAEASAMAREPVELAPLLSLSLDALRPRADRHGIQFQIEIASLGTVTGDGDRLRQVITNLLDNALKFTPDGGGVSLRAAENNGWVEIAVEDSGPGIPAEDLPRIFERFYQVDKSRAGREGAGLGLAISNEIVEAHGGTIRAESAPGSGSRFIVRLPSAKPGEPRSARSRTASH